MFMVNWFWGLMSAMGLYNKKVQNVPMCLLEKVVY